ncbi:MAG TPA: 1,4-alpha-glucan branching protein GlgB [Planctomycetota bacterium]|nr:1,4-alpha-glucan branching protein GlgB [Planctomycetota bacterium]
MTPDPKKRSAPPAAARSAARPDDDVPSLLGPLDLWLIGEGRHHRLWRVLGSHLRRVDGVDGTNFAVWAPNAQRVSVVGDFCDWDGSRHPMRSLGGTGVRELWVPGVRPGDLYKYELVGADGALRLKADPLAFKHEQWPGTASIVQRLDHHVWGDEAWMTARARRDATREPVVMYEVHIPSWRRVPEEHDRPLSYREIAPRLAEHCTRLGFTHVELLPVMEHPFGGSWGYQVTGFFAPTSRHGTPDDFRVLVDTLHQAGIGVLLDWVPAHFPADEHGLVRFDGTALYEHEDPREGRHPDWDTLIFNYGRIEVRNFLVASALYWLHECHVDGLRVDAVASMLYRDYSRKAGEWLPNKYGGRENLEAIDFLRQLNAAVRDECPGALMIAEESTAWGGVSASPESGGLGFAFKWNMGWMHDTLAYFGRDPVHRPWHHDQLTFAMLYEFSERFINPLSHDEVVHGKGSLLSRMPGDEWQRLANLRTLLAYMYTRPGKVLLFMGTELAPWGEWDHDHSLPWSLLDDPPHRDFERFVAELGRLYHAQPALWRRDPDPGGFQWIDCSDRHNSVLAFARWDEPRAGASTPDHLVTLLNLTPVPRPTYRIGVPRGCSYAVLLNTDAARWGGSELAVPDRVAAEARPWHGQQHSIELVLPPLAALVLRPEG